jgi:hypothetical protein
MEVGGDSHGAAFEGGVDEAVERFGGGVLAGGQLADAVSFLADPTPGLAGGSEPMIDAVALIRNIEPKRATNVLVIATLAAVDRRFSRKRTSSIGWSVPTARGDDDEHNDDQRVGSTVRRRLNDGPEQQDQPDDGQERTNRVEAGRVRVALLQLR